MINPFLDPDYLIDYNLRGRDVVEKLPDSEPDSDACNPSPADGLITKLGDHHYLYTDLCYQGKTIPALEFTTKPLCNGATKTQPQWADFSQDAKNNPDEWCATDAEILYQVMRRTVELKDDDKYKTVAGEIIGELQKLLDPKKLYLTTLTKIGYGTSLEATVSSLASFPGNHTVPTVDIPELTKVDNNWSYLVLADEQAESQLGTNKTIPQEANAGLEAILGEGYEKAATVFQCVSSRKDGKLREARYWTPTSTNRGKERVVALGVVNGGGFDIVTVGNVDGGPALGVRRAKKFPQEMKGG